jgi:hypothetical protein
MYFFHCCEVRKREKLYQYFFFFFLENFNFIVFRWKIIKSNDWHKFWSKNKILQVWCRVTIKLHKNFKFQYFNNVMILLYFNYGLKCPVLNLEQSIVDCRDSFIKHFSWAVSRGCRSDYKQMACACSLPDLYNLFGTNKLVLYWHLLIVNCSESNEINMKLLTYNTVNVSTHVPVCVWNNTQRGTWGLPPPVKLEICIMTWTVKKQTTTTKNNMTLVM